MDGPVVVLSHSIGTDHRVWDAQVAPLVAAGLRVVRYDHRGHGASPTPPGPYAIGDLGADVLALLDTLEVASASVVGISLGGMVALWLGAHAPGRVDRLVACCTSARIDPPDLWLERAAIARRDGMAALVDSILPRWVTPAFAEAHPEAMARLRDVVERTPGEGYAGCAEAIAAMDQTADLRRIRAPTLVVGGGQDVATPAAEHSAPIAAAIPGARLEILDAAPHLASVERPDEVTRVVLEHLRA
ncbi:MAG: 3-oxoadipate enol-lactonase [Solirubrobacteraceae bacterium]|nr:3-oxoadipate enol-lactonase [Solirubrobacteraceae bacterium]MEA2358630.1 3-oxoadipate enol-lactonase [Solirubrobacteraceae bacterium]